MHRRLILTGALALAAAPALAQSSSPPPTDAPAAPAPAAPAASEPAAAPAMKVAAPISLSDASEAHITNTMKVGSLSLATSRIAAEKVKHPMLKQFVGFEVAEQETIANILKGLMMPGSPPTATVKAPTDAELAGNLDPKGKETAARLRDMKAGQAFERDYIKAQIEGHRMLLEFQEAYLKTPDNHEETTLAKLAKGMITEHLALLADLEKQIG